MTAPRFVLPTQSERLADLYGGHLIVLADISYWNTHYEQLKDWCDEHLSEVRGMTVVVPNEKVLTLFCLKWS